MNVVDPLDALPESRSRRQIQQTRAHDGSDAADRQAADDGAGVCRFGGAAAFPGASCWRSSPAWRCALAAIGTYGILSYSVSERTKEIGIHMALGATRGSVLGMVLGQGMRLTIVGLVAGLAASFGLTRLLQAQLFNVKPTDPVDADRGRRLHRGCVALVACYVPAQRATRVDPMVTLRNS